MTEALYLLLYQDRLEEEIKSRAAVNAQEELSEEIQLAELLSNEYSLEEIIYQLARILFSQSLTKGAYFLLLHSGQLDHV